MSVGTTGSRFGAYEILSLLGAGGMGAVYRAHDQKLNRDVALKVLLPEVADNAERLARFRREAQILASLNHPNIGHIYGLEESDGVVALVLELVDGPTLADRIAKGAIPLDEALPIAKQIAEALEAAHEQGIVHRDLKPANIKVREDGTVKVLDFGLAKAMEPIPTNDRVPTALTNSPTITSPALMTGVGMLLGTAAYMSPEQAKGRTADKRSDLWAFGVVLYETLTGHLPFDGEDLVDVLGAVARLDPDWSRLPADLSPPLRTLLKSCLFKNRGDRPGDVAAVLFVLRNESLLSHGGPQPDRAISAAPRMKRKWALAVAAALLIAASVAAGVLVAHRPTSSNQPAMMLSLLPPDGIAWTPDTLPTISPDGRYVASLATQGEKRGAGQDGIWIRELGSGKARLLPGTERALYLFWSPDSKSIAFFEATELRRVDLAGGPPTRIANTRRAGSWGKDVIVFQTGTTGALSRVIPQGGDPTPVTTLNTAAGEVAHSYPWFLPDGRHFLYTAFDASNQGTVYLTEVGSNERRPLVSAAGNAVYAEPGFLIYLRGRTLMAQALDVNKGVMTSEAYPVADHLGFVRTQAQGRFSASQNGIIVYGGGDLSGGAQLTWFDRRGTRVGAVGDLAGGVQFPRISPDDDYILFDRQDDQTGVFGIWLYDVRRGITTRVTAPGEFGRYPVWVHDGARMLFVVFTPQRGIAVKEVRGSDPPRLIEAARSPVDGLRPLALSGKDEFLLAERIDPKTNSDIWIYPLSNELAKNANPYPYISDPGRQQYPAISPNGRWTAYASDESGRSEVYVQALPKAGAKWQISSNGGGYPVWSKDGRELYFIGSAGDLMATQVKDVGPFEAGTPQVVFKPHIVSNAWFDVSKDGRFLIPVQIEQTERAPITVLVNWRKTLGMQ